MNVVLLTSRDPLRAGDGALAAAVARDLADDGDDVALVLLEDAVTLARPGHALADDLGEAVAAGVRVLVEDEAARRRAVAVDDEVKTADMGEVVDLLMQWADRSAWL